MYRQTGINRYTLRQQRRLMAGKVVRDRIGGHTPRQGSVGTERFHIEEIAPASDRLSQHDAGERRISHRQHGQLLYTAHDKRHDQGADDSAVDGKPAAAQIENFLEIVLIIIPLERHIVGAGAHNGADHCPQNDIQSLIGVNPAGAVVRKIDPQSQSEARCNDDTVPVNFQPANGKRHSVDGELPPQCGKTQNFHGTPSLCFDGFFLYRVLYHSSRHFSILK